MKVYRVLVIKLHAFYTLTPTTGQKAA